MEGLLELIIEKSNPLYFQLLELNKCPLCKNKGKIIQYDDLWQCEKCNRVYVKPPKLPFRRIQYGSNLPNRLR